MERPTDAELRSSPKANRNNGNTKRHGLNQTMKGGNGASNGRGITQFAVGEPKSRNDQNPLISSINGRR